MDFLNIGLLFAVFILIVFLSWIWPPDSPWAPWWRTNQKTARKAFELAKLTDKDIVYELGSGEATSLMVAARDFGAKGVGIEIDPIRFYLSKFTIWQAGLKKQITLIRGNIFEEDFSDATVVFVYLVPKTLNRLLPKFKKLKKGTKVISYKYEISLLLKREDKKNKLFLYEI